MQKIAEHKCKQKKLFDTPLNDNHKSWAPLNIKLWKPRNFSETKKQFLLYLLRKQLDEFVMDLSNKPVALKEEYLRDFPALEECQKQISYDELSLVQSKT